MILAASMWFYAAGGAAISVFGPAVESIVDDFGLTYSQISLIITVISVGFIAGSLAGGAASDRWGRRAVMVPSAMGTAVAMFWFAASPTFGSLLAAGFLIGAGFGPGLAAATALIADLARERSTRDLNLFNSAFALGAIVAPPLVAICLAVTRKLAGGLRGRSRLVCHQRPILRAPVLSVAWRSRSTLS